MLCNLKISGRVPKIPIERKKLKIHIRLKITESSKNYGLKIPVRVRMYVRAYARAYECGQIAIKKKKKEKNKPTETPTEHQTTSKRATTSIQIKFAYIIGMIAKNDKKMKKS